MWQRVIWWVVTKVFRGTNFLHLQGGRLYNLADRYQHFWESVCLHLQDISVSNVLDSCQRFGGIRCLIFQGRTVSSMVNRYQCFEEVGYLSSSVEYGVVRKIAANAWEESDSFILGAEERIDVYLFTNHSCVTYQKTLIVGTWQYIHISCLQRISELHNLGNISIHVWCMKPIQISAGVHSVIWS
jgi:hypothetical protein